MKVGGVDKRTRNNTASDGDVRAGAALRWSRDALASVLNEAQCAGFSTSIPEQGMPSIICALAARSSCGQTYDAIAIPELTMVRTRKKAMNRINDGSVRRIKRSRAVEN